MSKLRGSGQIRVRKTVDNNLAFLQVGIVLMILMLSVFIAILVPASRKKIFREQEPGGVNKVIRP